VKYSHILESLLMPAYYGMRGRAYAKQREFLERSQWWSREQIREFQWNELQRLLEHAFRSVPYYRKKYREAGIELGDLRNRENFAKLPPLSREEINAHRAELCSNDQNQSLIPHATGGSSGLPTRFFVTTESYDWRCAASARAYSWSGCRVGERTLYLWGAPVGQISRFKKTKLDSYRFLRREFVVPTFSQTPELWRKAFEVAVRFCPEFLVGYASSLQQFAEFLLDRNLVIPGIRAVLAAAEPVHEATRDLAQRAFRAPLFDTYGSREFMSIAAECESHQGLHIHSENLLVETEQNSDETPSEFLITDLHNYGMPFIRYRIGDVGLLNNSSCPCGRGLPVITGIDGRVLEVLRTQDGRVISPILWRHVLKDVVEAKEYEVRQTKLDEIVISMVLDGPLSVRSETLLRQEMAKVFTPATRVTIRPVDAIPRLPSGKRRLSVGMGQPA
jgi:phenylacetate-CoA ligase